MSTETYTVRNAQPLESEEIGKLMVRVYSQLEGFPKEAEQPHYYKMLANVGDLTSKPETELLAAVSADGKIAGAVVYFADMQHYGSGGTLRRKKILPGSDYWLSIRLRVVRYLTESEHSCNKIEMKTSKRRV